MKADWEIKKLGEVCEIECGTRVVRKVDGGTIFPVYGGGGATFNMDTFNREDCLIVSRFAMSEKCTRFVKGKFFLNDSGLSLKTKEDIITQKYLETVILSKNDEIYLLGRGAAQKNLDMAKFRELEISYPVSLHEQKRIVEILDQKFAQIDQLKQNAEKNLQNAKELFQAELTKAFSNNTWEKKRLGEIISVLTDFNANGGYAKLDSNVKMYDEPNYAIMVRTTDLERNDFNHGVKYVDKQAYKLLSKSSLYGNEIIMNKIGSAGKIYLMPYLNQPATLARNAFLIRFYETIDVKFVFSYLTSPEGTTSIMKHVHGAVTKTITKDEVRSIEIPLPPLSEQQEIVAHLDVLQEKLRQLKEIYTKQIANCDELKQSFLKKAFEGEL